jgi:ABC-type glycerol-3-phosphate transport system substrate-binding protein
MGMRLTSLVGLALLAAAAACGSASSPTAPKPPCSSDEAGAIASYGQPTYSSSSNGETIYQWSSGSNFYEEIFVAQSNGACVITTEGTPF